MCDRTDRSVSESHLYSKALRSYLVIEQMSNAKRFELELKRFSKTTINLLIFLVFFLFTNLYCANSIFNTHFQMRILSNIFKIQTRQLDIDIRIRAVLNALLMKNVISISAPKQMLFSNTIKHTSLIMINPGYKV